ncbi:MAG TPA: hypothetical protein VFI37_04400 [Gaiellaceae bacterium]|nr:hypothetical protein [Gaiellaceae bacterium]
MRRIHLLVAVVTAAALIVGVASATAGKPSGNACAGGTLASGTYGSITITNTCAPAPGAAITIDGNLTLAAGAVFNDHAGVPASITITGNVKVGQGAVLGLGSYNPTAAQVTVVDGNVVANKPASLYLSFMTVRGNLISNGGGTDDRNFPIKDDTVGGNVVIQGWHGFWMGLLRTTVGGNVIIANNTAADTSQLPGIDSTEVVNNDIAGNLICHHNTPVAQLGDTEQPPSRVGGNTLGECAHELPLATG